MLALPQQECTYHCIKQEPWPFLCFESHCSDIHQKRKLFKEVLVHINFASDVEVLGFFLKRSHNFWKRQSFNVVPSYVASFTAHAWCDLAEITFIIYWRTCSSTTTSKNFGRNTWKEISSCKFLYRLFGKLLRTPHYYIIICLIYALDWNREADFLKK